MKETKIFNNNEVQTQPFNRTEQISNSQKDNKKDSFADSFLTVLTVEKAFCFLKNQ